MARREARETRKCLKWTLGEGHVESGRAGFKGTSLSPTLSRTAASYCLLCTQTKCIFSRQFLLCEGHRASLPFVGTCTHSLANCPTSCKSYRCSLPTCSSAQHDMATGFSPNNGSQPLNSHWDCRYTLFLLISECVYTAVSEILGTSQIMTFQWSNTFGANQNLIIMMPVVAMECQLTGKKCACNACLAVGGILELAYKKRTSPWGNMTEVEYTSLFCRSKQMVSALRTRQPCESHQTVFLINRWVTEAISQLWCSYLVSKVLQWWYQIYWNITDHQNTSELPQQDLGICASSRLQSSYCVSICRSAPDCETRPAENASYLSHPVIRLSAVALDLRLD